MILSFLSVQYALHLYYFFTDWRKNPQWSVSCCLALLLPFIGLHGEISGLVGTNVLDKQLETGQIERPTIQTAVQESGAIDVTLEQGDQAENDSIRGNSQSFDVNDTKWHQGTQTEISVI